MITNFEPRQWQKVAFSQLKKSNFNAIVEAPTAAGKTVFGIMAISILRIRHPGLKTVIIVPTITLLRQWKHELIKFLGLKEEDVGLYYGAKKDVSIGKKFMIYVINSAAKEKNLVNQQILNPFDFIIIDEVHHIGAISFAQLLEINTFKYKLGISATPQREYDGEGTKKIYDFFKEEIIVSPEYVERAPVTYNMIRVRLTSEEEKLYKSLQKKSTICLSNLKKYYDLGKEKQLFFKRISELAESGVEEAKAYISLLRRMENIRFTARNKLKAIKNLAHKDLNKKTIIFCDRISFVEEISETLKKCFPQREIYIIHSNLKKKEQKTQLQKFKSSNNSILVAAKIVDEGFDVPDASIGVFVSFTKSKRQSIQRDGRILRFLKNKIATKYIFVIKDIDEGDYCSILIRTGQLNHALNGAWIDFDNNQFSISSDFKTGFRLQYLTKTIKSEI